MSVKPKVFGHRGACAYRPENTMEAFKLAYDQGVYAIECDIVPTKDHALVLRHENALSGTTDVASKPEFAQLKRAGFVDGQAVQDWFTEDMTLAEVKQLRAIERLPDWRPGSAAFDGQFEVPTLAELLAAPFLNNRAVILEVKHGAYFEKQGIPVVEILKAEIDKSDWQNRGIRFIFESFNLDVLTRARALLGEIGEYVFLVDRDHLPGKTRYVSDEFLSALVGKVHGVSFDIDLLLGQKPAFSSADFGSPTGLVERAHALGFTVFTWTARVEQALYSVEEYLQHFIDTDADGIFSDHPDLLLSYVDGHA
ncbi:MAG: glycerophosphodiester phosphodiesterase family protein [Microbacteriaceae bacterium]